MYTASTRAILFDLDGVLTDTAELHFQAWNRLCLAEGIPFSRRLNEKLRGIPRMDSLDLILRKAGRTESSSEKQRMTAAKNDFYGELLDQLTPAHRLRGAETLIQELRQMGVLIAVASASKNASTVIDKLGLDAMIDLLVDGNSVERLKPEPDLFLNAAEKLHLHPSECIVVEDAAAGIRAAHAAGMPAVGIGPLDRVGEAEVILPGLESASADDILQAGLWRASEPVFLPVNQNRFETILSSGNGFMSTRATLEERFPGDKQAAFINGVYDDAPVLFTEFANLPDWTALSFSVDGHPFSMNSSGISSYARWLDLSTGVLHRRLRWKPAPDISAIDITFSRFTSLADNSILAQQLTITALDRDCSLTVSGNLDSHVENEGRLHWLPVQQASSGQEMQLAVRTRRTGITAAFCMALNAAGINVNRVPLNCKGNPGIALTGTLKAGETAVFEKIGAVCTSRQDPDPLDAAVRKCGQANQAGFVALLQANNRKWQEFWRVSDVLIDGDPEAQLAIRHGLFQLRIAAPTTNETVSIPAKTLSGFAYAGHVFWDTEIYVMPFFTFTQPGLARNMLRYRWHTLEGARRNAAPLPGARFAWESAATGDEVTPTWVPDPHSRTELIRIWTGDRQLHITADIPYAMHQYWQHTGDDDFWLSTGIPILLETAVWWGEHVDKENDHYSLRGVIGCDEYHEKVDNNAFTNYMIRWHLRQALEALDWLEKHHPLRRESLVSSLDLTPSRLQQWKQISETLVFLRDPDSGIIEQFEGFFNLKAVDWERFTQRTSSMQDLIGIQQVNEYQVLKQPDVLTLFALFEDRFPASDLRTNWDLYHPITDHSYGSSLGPALHAWLAARLNLPDTALEHFMRAARADLGDIRGNAADGIHAASAGGLWQAVVFGFAGLSIVDGRPRMNPHLPQHWNRIEFKIRLKGDLLKIQVNRQGGEVSQI